MIFSVRITDYGLWNFPARTDPYNTSPAQLTPNTQSRVDYQYLDKYCMSLCDQQNDSLKRICDLGLLYGELVILQISFVWFKKLINRTIL